jgi:hypothetical protein
MARTSSRSFASWRDAVGIVAAGVLIAGCSAGPAIAPTLPALSATPPTATRNPAPTPRPAVAMPAGALAEIPLPGGPNTIAISSDRVWVELHRGNSLASVDPKTLAVATYPDVHVHCHIASDGANAVWTAYHQDNLVSLVDATSGLITHTATIPDACGVGASAEQIWVTSPSASRIYRLDPATGATLFDRAVDRDPFTVIPLGDVVYASGEGGGGWLEAIDSIDGHSIGKRHLPDVELVDVVGLGFDALWAVGRTSTKLYRLDPTTLETKATIDIGFEPSGLAIGRDAIWVPQLNGRLTRVDPASNVATATWSMPYTWLAYPVLGFDRLWITSLEENVLVAIDLSKLAP